MTTRAELLQTLQATPRRVGELATALVEDQLAQRPKEGEWSLAEILNHLVLGERDVILPRLKRMLREDAPVFPSSATPRTGFAAEPRSGDFAAGLAEFRQIRTETLSFLRTLKDPEWERIGTTPTRGMLTIEAYARYLAQHDLEHLAQMEAARGMVREQAFRF